MIGAGAIIENNTLIRSFTKILTGAYICADTEIGSNCFIGPRVVMLNDRYLGHNNIPKEVRAEQRKGPTLRSNVYVGGNSTLLPGVTLNRGVVIGAGSLVSKDLLVKGVYYNKDCVAVWQGKEIGIKASG